ncbi:MAG: aldehyde dehydrogenase family protein, partial [Nocardia sp.]|nr:aldehyde dehydrogenase family protein [Nocardia sp.]
QFYNDAVEQAAAIAQTLKVGDPHDKDIVIGPLVAKRQQDRVLGYIDIAKDEGATIVTGGKRPAAMEKGWFVEPTVLSGVENSMRIAQEEIFGPVVSFIPYEGDEQALAITNDTNYGLDGAVWTGDQERGMAIARRIRSGNLSVNGGIAPYPKTPYGGFKQSGYGRELGVEGLGMYLETKTIAAPSA